MEAVSETPEAQITELKTVLEPESETETEAGNNVETELESEPKSESESEPESEFEPETETEIDQATEGEYQFNLLANGQEIGVDTEVVFEDENEEEIPEGEGEKPLDYDVEISWGNMMFVYDYGATWNPKTHSYTGGIESGRDEAGWALKYLNKVNNCITIVNKTDNLVDVEIAFLINGTFNSNKFGTNSVAGVFNENNTYLMRVTEANDTGYEFANEKGLLSYNGTFNNGTYNIYFSLCGSPDESKIINSEKTIGSIIITMVPHE